MRAVLLLSAAVLIASVVGAPEGAAKAPTGSAGTPTPPKKKAEKKADKPAEKDAAKPSENNANPVATPVTVSEAAPSAPNTPADSLNTQVGIDGEPWDVDISGTLGFDLSTKDGLGFDLDSADPLAMSVGDDWEPLPTGDKIGGGAAADPDADALLDEAWLEDGLWDDGFAASFASLDDAKDTITRGGVMKAGRMLVSRNKNSTVWMQTDGNLVLLHNDKPVWSAMAEGKGATRVAVTRNGTLALFNRSTVVWNTTVGGCDKFIVQDDGNFVGYAGSVPLWAANKFLPTPTSDASNATGATKPPQ